MSLVRLGNLQEAFLGQRALCAGHCSWPVCLRSQLNPTSCFSFVADGAVFASVVLIAFLTYDPRLSGVLATAATGARALPPLIIYPIYYLLDPLGWFR